VENIFSSVENPQPAFGWGFFFPGRISCQVLPCHVSPVIPEMLVFDFEKSLQDFS
jgi:hypothetical protein